MLDWLNLPELDLPAIVELSKYKQWLTWKVKQKPGVKKFTKPPYNARTGILASVTEPSDWSSYQEAYQACQDSAAYAGIGFVLTSDDPFTGVDLDNCHDPDTGEISDWAKEIVQKVDSYTEISPSGTGLRIIVKGDVVLERNRKDSLEVYITDRYLTMTGTHLAWTPEHITDNAGVLHDVFGTAEQTSNHPSQNSQLQAIIDELAPEIEEDMTMPADKLSVLWENVPVSRGVWDRTHGNFESNSEWDLSMCNYFVGARWTHIEIMAGLIQFRRAANAEPKLRADYYARTILAAKRGREREEAQHNLTPEFLDMVDSDDKRSHIKESLFQIYGFKFLRIMKYMMDPHPIYRIVTDRGSVSGGVDLIVTQGSFRKSIAQATGIVVRTAKAAIWDETAQSMLTICEDIDLGSDATDAGYGTSLVQRFLEERSEVATEFNEDVAADLRPYKDKEYLCIFSQAINKFARLNEGSNMSPQRMAVLLRSAGWQPKQKAFGPKNKRTNINIWFKLYDDVYNE